MTRPDGTPTEALEQELSRLRKETRVRRSVDAFARAAVEGFLWAVLAGICGKLLWDSARLPLLFYPLAFLDLLLLGDALRHCRIGRTLLSRERAALSRLREVRRALGIDPPVYETEQQASARALTEART